MAAFSSRAAIHPMMFAVGGILTLLGLVAFNLGYVWLYVAFLPLLCMSIVLSVEVHVDFFLSLLLLVTASTLLYLVGIFALSLVACALVLSLPLILLLSKSHFLQLPEKSVGGGPLGWRTLELCSLFLITLFARYVLYRAGGGALPLRIGEFESFSRFLISEVGGWVVFAVGYGVQLRSHGSLVRPSEGEFAASLPSLLAAGLFFVSPYVAILTLGLNLFGLTGLYVGSLPVGAAYLLLRILTNRRLAIERQNLRLQQMNVELARSGRLAAIGEMSSAISHQLLQKVGLVGLQCSLLRDVLLEDSTSVVERLREGRDCAEQLDESIADLNTTLSDLLVFSKDIALHLDSCDLDSFLRDIVEEVGILSNEHRVDLVYWCEAVETSAVIDRIKMKQAIFNLLRNATEASPSQSRVDVVLRGDAGEIQIEVADQGQGISEADLDRIFAPFFSTKTRGTGIGLTFAQKIVSLHGGTLIANNNRQGGATFIITLPRRKPSRE